MDEYEKAIEKMAEALWETVPGCALWVELPEDTRNEFLEDASAAAEAIGLRETHNALRDCLAFIRGDISGPEQRAGIIAEAEKALRGGQ